LDDGCGEENYEENKEDEENNVKKCGLKKKRKKIDYTFALPVSM